MCNGDALVPPDKPIEQVPDRRRDLLPCQLVRRGTGKGLSDPPRRLVFGVMTLNVSLSGLQCMSS